VGLSTDVPVPGDYNGDGTTDIAVYRRSTGSWYVSPSKLQLTTSSVVVSGVGAVIPTLDRP
jgi:hypothetical protein